MTLPPLNSVKSCPKCGVEFYQTKVVPNHAAAWTWTESVADTGTVPSKCYCDQAKCGQCVERACPTCGYSWNEACAEAVPNAEASKILGAAYRLWDEAAAEDDRQHDARMDFKPEPIEASLSPDLLATSIARCSVLDNLKPIGRVLVVDPGGNVHWIFWPKFVGRIAIALRQDPKFIIQE